MRPSSRVAQVATCTNSVKICSNNNIILYDTLGVTFPSHPEGYRQSSSCPILRGRNNCPNCLCSPCVIALPPDFLRGACGPHPANDEKRYRLYKAFWKLLNTLGVFQDEEYLLRKERRTIRADKREIIPKCVITVSKDCTVSNR